MCTVCGCGEGETKIGGAPAHDHDHDHGHEHEHVMPDGRVVRHTHSHSHGHTHTHTETHAHSHSHAHDHQHTHDHEHVGPDGKVYRHTHGHAHAHSHDHGHDHGHSHDHGHVHGGHAHEHKHDHVGPDGTVIRHTHGHGHDHDHGHDHNHGTLDLGRGPAGTEVPGMSQARLVTIERDILAKNDSFAAVNRQLFKAKGVLTLNLMSSPGSGKTTLLARTLTDLKGRFPTAVIEGDQQTSFDADRIRATGTPAIQINTGKGCHLDAQMVTQALGRLDVKDGSALFVENVGNLVCPAGFDLGEAHKVVVLSVTEGEDKPLKYPNMFAAADLLLVNKVDLLPHLTFDVERMVEYARRLKPGLEVLQVSATTGQGLDAWYAWIEAGLAKARA